MSVSSRALFNAAQPPRPLLSDLHGMLDGLVEQIGDAFGADHLKVTHFRAM